MQNVYLFAYEKCLVVIMQITHKYENCIQGQKRCQLYMLY